MPRASPAISCRRDELLQACVQQRAHAGGVVQQALRLDDLDVGQRDGALEGVALVRAAWTNERSQRLLGERRRRDDGRRGHAAAERLGDDDDVRHDVRVLEGEPAAGPPQARQRLVGDQQRAALVAPARTACSHSAGTGTMPPAPSTGSTMTAAGSPLVERSMISTQRSQHPRPAGGAAEQAAALERRRDQHDARRRRPGTAPHAAARRGEGEGGAGAPVVAAHQADELEAAGDELRDADRRLVRLRARAAEEGARQRIGRECGQPLGELDARRAGEAVADLHQPRGLLADRRLHARCEWPVLMQNWPDSKSR